MSVDGTFNMYSAKFRYHITVHDEFSYVTKKFSAWRTDQPKLDYNPRQL